jgi:hypothetical protein
MLNGAFWCCGSTKFSPGIGATAVAEVYIIPNKAVTNNLLKNEFFILELL